MLSDIKCNKANLTIALARHLTNALGVNLVCLFASASHDVDPIQATGPRHPEAARRTERAPFATQARVKPRRC